MRDQVVNFEVNLSKWNVKKPLADVVWVLMVDEPDSDTVTRASGLILPTTVTTRGAFRIGKALKVGPKVKDIVEGDFLLIPPNVGLFGHKSLDGYKTLFIQEDKVLSTIDFDGNKEEFLKHQNEELFATV